MVIVRSMHGDMHDKTQIDGTASCECFSRVHMQYFSVNTLTMILTILCIWKLLMTVAVLVGNTECDV